MTSTSANQFPQPTRPLNSYDMSYEVPSTVYPQVLENSTPSNFPHHDDNIVGLGYQQQSINHHHVVVPPRMDTEKKRERKHELVVKIVDKVLDKYEKLEEGKSQRTTSRGLQQRVEAGEKGKLERFKIRTVVIAEEVVKEDDDKK